MGLLGNGILKVLGYLLGDTLDVKNNSLAQAITSVAGIDSHKQYSVLEVVMHVIQNGGGLEPLIELFKKNGLASKPESWVGDGPNEEFAPEQVEQLLGNSIVNQIASKLGVDSAQATSIVARVLPELINQITPQGSVSGEQDSIISKALSMLSRL